MTAPLLYLLCCSPAEHPGVFAAAALRRVDDERAAAQRDAGQAAGQNRDALAVENVGPQVDMARFDLAFEKAGRTREVDGRLGDVVARVGDDAAGKVVALGCACCAGRSACRSRPIRPRP